MALEYSAVQWNRQKRIYDFVLAVGVGAFLILFGVLSKGYRGCRCAQPPANFWQPSGLARSVRPHVEQYPLGRPRQTEGFGSAIEVEVRHDHQ